MSEKNVQGVKISALPEGENFDGLYTIGVDSQNRSVKVPLRHVGEATENANQSAEAADGATLRTDQSREAMEADYYKGASGEGSYAEPASGTVKARANSDHSRADEDSGRADADHTRAEGDHSTAVEDHGTAGTDHTRAEGDQSQAVEDSGRAGTDHTRAEEDHSQAVSDSGRAGTDHTRAEEDHSQAVEDSGRAGTDHTRAEEDHSQAVSDSGRAGTDHTRAEGDHADYVENMKQDYLGEDLTGVNSGLRKNIVDATSRANSAAAILAVEDISRMERDFAQYAESESVVLATGTAGQVVDNRGVVVGKSGYAISAPFRMQKGMMYLLRTPSAVDNGVALVSKKVVNSQIVAINYTYTYDENGRTATATADYDTSKVYTFNYTGGEGEAEVLTIEGPDGYAVEYLPQTRVATSGSYIPLFKSLSSTLPKQGFYVVLCMEDCDAVVSAQAGFVNGGEVVVTSYGLVRSIINNLSSEGHEHPQLNVVDEVGAHAIATLEARVEALERYIHGLTTGQVKAEAIATYKLDILGDDSPALKMGHGTPDYMPRKAGYMYIDLDSGRLYVAKSNTAVSWEEQ